MKILNLLLILVVSVKSSSYAQTVTIGTQVWSAKNLNVSTFRNGDPIKQAKTDIEWRNANALGQPAWCYYNNDPANGVKYGKLYNWYAVNDPRGLAPKGWHIPSDDEWEILTDFLGGELVSGVKMKSTSGWSAGGANGQNTSGFSGLPGGTRSGSSREIGKFGGVGSLGRFWSSTETHPNFANNLLLYSGASITYFNQLKSFGLSVRCVRD
jgi:uncharacterized protein (TIGR02145 family)